MEFVQTQIVGSGTACFFFFFTEIRSFLANFFYMLSAVYYVQGKF